MKTLILNGKTQLLILANTLKMILELCHSERAEFGIMPSGRRKPYPDKLADCFIWKVDGEEKVGPNSERNIAIDF